VSCCNVRTGVVTLVEAATPRFYLENADRSSGASKRRIDSRVGLAACKYSRE
jgi:hypothetical protein